MYDEKSKERTMRYMKEKRDKLTLNLPLGDIVELIEDDISKDKTE